MSKNLSKIAKQLGSRGGKKSVEVRFGGKTDKEISEIMSKVRTNKQSIKFAKDAADETVKSLRGLQRP